MRLRRKHYSTPGEKQKDSLLGFGLAWGINILMLWLGLLAWNRLATARLTPGTRETLRMALLMAPWFINLGLILWAAFVRPFMALGAVVALGCALGGAAVLFVLTLMQCFPDLQSLTFHMANGAKPL